MNINSIAKSIEDLMIDALANELFKRSKFTDYGQLFHEKKKTMVYRSAFEIHIEATQDTPVDACHAKPDPQGIRHINDISKLRSLAKMLLGIEEDAPPSKKSPDDLIPLNYCWFQEDMLCHKNHQCRGCKYNEIKGI